MEGVDNGKSNGYLEPLIGHAIDLLLDLFIHSLFLLSASRPPAMRGRVEARSSSRHDSLAELLDADNGYANSSVP